MKYLKYFIFCAAIILNGCSKTDIVETDIENQASYVVYAELRANEIFSGVTITHTLPVNIKYDIKLAEIKDAYVYIKVNGIQLIPLHYNADGVYKPVADFRINEGSIYELFGTLSGQNFYSQTKVPGIPNVLSVAFTPGNYFDVTVKARPDEAYGVIWGISQYLTEGPGDFVDVQLLGPNVGDSLINLRTAALPPQYLTSEFNNNRFIQVYSFDKDYQAYFKTKGSANTSINEFAQQGSSPIWNIKGQKFIGLFIGVNHGGPLPGS